MTNRTHMLTPASQIRTKRMRFLDNSLGSTIPIGTLAVFSAQAGVAKSTFVGDKCARLTNGELPGDSFGQPRNVLIWSGEDPWESVVIPRLIAAGANLDNVYKLDIASTYNEETRETTPMLPLDSDHIRAAIEETNAAFVLIDPIASTTQANTDRETEVRSILDPLARIAEDTGAVIAFIKHFNKTGGSISNKISGSHAFRDAVRASFALVIDEETGNRIVTQDKGNYSTDGNSSIAFRLESVTVPTDDGELAEVAKVVMLGESELSANEILNRGFSNEDSAGDRSAALAFILDQIDSSSDGEINAGECIAAAKRSGFTEDEIKNARKRSKHPKIVSKKSGFSKSWVWARGDETAEEVAKVSKVSAFENVTRLTSSLDSVTSSPEPIARISPTCSTHNAPLYEGECGRCLAEAAV